jgi:hypothetical protein
MRPGNNFGVAPVSVQHVPQGQGLTEEMLDMMSNTVAYRIPTRVQEESSCEVAPN